MQQNEGFIFLYSKHKLIKSMLEFTKKILRSVSFDPLLFQKELYKGLRWINDAEEMQRFHEWCITEFGNTYPKIIKKAFSSHNKLSIEKGS